MNNLSDNFNNEKTLLASISNAKCNMLTILLHLVQ